MVINITDKEKKSDKTKKKIVPKTYGEKVGHALTRCEDWMKALEKLAHSRKYVLLPAEREDIKKTLTESYESTIKALSTEATTEAPILKGDRFKFCGQPKEPKNY